MLEEMLDLFKNFAKNLQGNESVLNYNEAKKKVELDSELQKKMEELRTVRSNLNLELAGGAEATKIEELRTDMQKLYDEIMSNANMIKFNEFRAWLDKFVNDINCILMHTIDGGDPYEADLDAYGHCGGSCSSCGGCH
jgi:cell fate (sporulation/competence/biofilm development) regulator YlbF (YheA/YmcA/DUF963 family)